MKGPDAWKETSRIVGKTEGKLVGLQRDSLFRAELSKQRDSDVGELPYRVARARLDYEFIA